MLPLCYSTFSVCVEQVGLAGTFLSGDFDSVFCTGSILAGVQADCGGDDPTVICSCCVTCCGPDSCEQSLFEFCDFIATNFEENNLPVEASCSCPTDGKSVSCDFTECPTCNEDRSVCGMTSQFRLDLSDAGVPQRFQSRFEYITEGREGIVIDWETTHSPQDCKISLNGEECHSCTIAPCADGFQGISIDCSNVFVVDGSPFYNSCFPGTSGIFDVFEWTDDASIDGCPFVLPAGSVFDLSI